MSSIASPSQPANLTMRELPGELLEEILGCCAILFQIVQFRSVCTSWRSAIPLPSDSTIPNDLPRTLGTKIRIPFNNVQLLQRDEHCTLKNIPIFLLRFQTPFGFDYFVSAMDQTKPEKAISMKSPLSCEDISPGRHEMLLNTLTSHIIPLGYHYEIKFYQMVAFNMHGPEWEKVSQRAELVELDTEGHYMVLAGDESCLMVFRSQDMSWTYVVDHPNAYGIYQDTVAYKGNFYVVDLSGWGQVFDIEPSLEVTEIPPVSKASQESSQESLVRSGEDLLLVQRFTPGKYFDEHMYTWFRVFKLDGEGSRRRWVQINELKDQVIFLGYCKNLCLSLDLLPDDVKGNCIVFIKPEECIINGKESILVFDLGTRKTSTAISQSRGFMGAFGLNLEALVSGGIVTMQNPAISIYDL